MSCFGAEALLSRPPPSAPDLSDQVLTVDTNTAQNTAVREAFTFVITVKAPKTVQTTTNRSDQRRFKTRRQMERWSACQTRNPGYMKGTSVFLFFCDF